VTPGCNGQIEARVLEYRRRIRCKKIFAVPGNHDKQARKMKEKFSWLDNLAEVLIHGQPIVLCHYALRVWNRSNRGSWHLNGHSHTAWSSPLTGQATLRRAKVPYFRIYDLRSTYATRLSAGGVADEWVTQLLRQRDAKVFKKYSQMKLQMKREALVKLNRQANEQNLDQKIDQNIGYDTARVNWWVLAQFWHSSKNEAKRNLP
jgi:hypothetical protein